MLERVDEFLAFGMFERHFSKNTQEAYRNDLLQLGKWLSRNKKDFLNADLSDLTYFLVEKKSEGYQFSSIARTLFCLRVFFTWLQSNRTRTDNPAELLESPKLWTTLPELLAPDEIDLLLESVDGKLPIVLRTRAIIETLYGCGLRISELTGLKTSDLNLSQDYLKSFGKGSKERIIPFPKSVKKALTTWLTKGRPVFEKGKSSEFLFIGQKKKPLTRQHVWLEIKKLAMKAGIQKNIHPHIFRHSYATHLLAGGGDLRIVQELLGHADIMTTQKYTQVDKSHMLKMYNRFHPRA